ncbi:hypothetical protein Tco_0287261 [Tanacetum coccineum]
MANKHSIMTREMVESFCNSYYIPDEVHPTAPGRDRTITQFPEGKVGVYTRTADPRKVQAVEVQKGEEQVKLLDSIKHCFVSLDAPAAVQQEGGSGSGASPEVSAPSAEGNVVAEENIIPVGDAARKQPEKAKRKKLLKQSDTFPAKRLRVDHPSLASGTGGKTLASLRRTILEGSLLLGPSSPADVHTHVTVRSSRVADAPVYTAADTVTSSRGKTLAAPTSNVGGSSQPETSEESADSLKDVQCGDGATDLDWVEYGSRTEHELDLKQKLQIRRRSSGRFLRSSVQVSVLTTDKSFLSAEVSALKSAVSQKDTDISLLDSVPTDGLASEGEAHSEAQAQVLYNRVADLEAHVMDVSGRLEGEFYPAYLTALAGRRWLLTHGVELAMVKCLKSPTYRMAMET